MDKETCLRCGGHMSYAGREYLQKGKMGFFLGEWSNLLSGAYDVEVYVCDRCHKMEFYAAEGSGKTDQAEENGGAMAQIPCPHCGTMHDMDDPRCPFCGKRLMEPGDGREHEEP